MSDTPKHLNALVENIKSWGRELGFQQIAVTKPELSDAAQHLRAWLNKGYQGDMAWMAEHGDKRWRPDKLLPGTQRVISARMDYLPADTPLTATLNDRDKAYISRYALGRDYHKLMRKRLAVLAARIESETKGAVIQRPFVDSAPVLEKPLAAIAGLGWMGKNTLIINSSAGSWFFLGEIYTSLNLPIDSSTQIDRCGPCRACLNICPTQAFPQPYVLDARRCISYLTIEHKGAIDEELRPLMGNRVFGCDDCQAICPWNRHANSTQEDDFKPRHNLEDSALLRLFLWSEEEFDRKTAGSPIRRIGYQRWQRNLAIGLGNGSSSNEVIAAIRTKREESTSLVREHLDWALAQLEKSAARPLPPKLFPQLK